jgi:hypothetical protein
MRSSPGGKLRRIKTQQNSAKKPNKKASVERTIGIDIGDHRSHYCVLDAAGEVWKRDDSEPNEKRWPGTSKISFPLGSLSRTVRIRSGSTNDYVGVAMK